MSSILPDFLAPGLRVVFCGTAVAKKSASVGHYYAGRGYEFWPYLYDAKITPELLSPSSDRRVLEFGIGLTDLVKEIAASSDKELEGHYDVSGFVTKIEQYRPAWVAFHGMEAAKQASKALGHGGAVALGRRDWEVANARVFVLPNASGSNRDPARWGGKADRVEWFKDLARLLPRSRSYR